MIVRIYNKETYEADYYYDVKEVHEGDIDFVLEMNTGSPIAFDNDLYSYCVVRR